MTDINSRIENAKKIVTGNVAMLDMLDADPATELMNWGIDLAAQIAQSTDGMDDATAEQAMEPRMKALRQFLRGAGNWAVGKYDAANRPDLKNKITEQWKNILGKESPASIEGMLDLVDDPQNTPHHLILKLKETLASS